MQIKKSKLKIILTIILLLFAIIVLLHTKLAVRCMLMSRLNWEITFSSDTDTDYIVERRGLVFKNKGSLIWLREQAATAQIVRRPFGAVCSTAPAPLYYAGNTFIGDSGNLSYRFLITTYYFYIKESSVLSEYSSDCLANGSMPGIK